MRIHVWCAVIAVMGCGARAGLSDAGLTLPVDAGAPTDAGSPTDAGVPDAGMIPGATDLGARVDATAAAIDFRLFSANATRIELSLYRVALATEPVLTATLQSDGKGTFSTRVLLSALPGNALTEPLFYGYRAWGPNWPYDAAWKPGSLAGFVSEVDAKGNRFNPNKVLFDPYALEMSHDPTHPGALDGSPFQNDAARRQIDSGPRAPKGVVLAPTGEPLGPRPLRPLRDEVIYEVHLRGLTRNDLTLPEAIRGTYAGAAKKAASLAALGVTAIELLPVQETQNDTNDVDPTSVNGDNYWGYSTLSYFAPDRRYAADRSPGGPTREFQQMVRAFHDAGLKVYIDVVYNHTGEYGLLSFRGLDNPTYYSLTDDRRGSVNLNGVSGNFNTRNPAAQALIVDSLRYWHEVLGVDGYRFDLAPILGNTCEHGCFRYDRVDPATALNKIAKVLPARPVGGGTGVDLIAEPWAIGGGTYQLGNFPSGWAEWNDGYRDAVRSTQNLLGVGSPPLKVLTERLGGSHDLFNDDGRKPGSSINFLVAHDGFTLNDLYACNGKNNGQAWPYGPSNGGSDDNRSWDQGGSAVAQRRAARTGMALLMLSAGTPMMTGGDEQLHSLRCNNNPYNLDSEANALSYTLSAEQAQFRVFTQRLLQFRAAHPALRPAGWYRLDDSNGNGLEQMRAFTPGGAAVDDAYLGNTNNHAVGLRIDGTELGDPAAAIYIAYNGWSGNLDFKLPSPGTGKTWFLVGDTCDGAAATGSLVVPGAEQLLGGTGTQLQICARGLALLVAK